MGQDGNGSQWPAPKPVRFWLNDHAVLITLDGLSHTELRHALDEGWLPQLSRLDTEQSTWVKGGSIVGWPSFSFPGHILIHMGAYQGHHGILSNTFWDREQMLIALNMPSAPCSADPQAAQATQDQYLSRLRKPI